MARKLSNPNLLRLWLMRHRSQPTGFTLLELLVSLLIGAIITSLLLYTVVELLQTNQREAARSDTQRDMQAALDYISRDLREAIYVYDSNCFTGNGGTPGTARNLCPGLTATGILPTNSLVRTPPPTGTNTPVLAFWRVDELPDSLKTHCNTQLSAFGNTPSAAATAAVSGVACLSQRTYTLVVYSIRTEPTTNSIWRGRARLTRYELPQFPANQPSLPRVTQTTGWGSPVRDDGGFIIWPFTTNTAAPTFGDTRTLSTTNPPLPATAADPVVVVDFLDDAPATATDTQCPSVPPSTPSDYVRTPAAPSPRGFYVCVNGATAPTNPPSSVRVPIVNQNQEVVVYLRGNAAGRSGVPRNGNLLIPMETRVMTRGALQKPGS
jgi:prepilin-type N-terminal cleavage/methylation domain-containing protein